MIALVFLALVSAVLTLAMTPVVRRFSLRFGAVDTADGSRKLHANPVPRTGGLAIFFAYVLSFAALFATPLTAGHLVAERLEQVLSILPAALLIFAIGLYDDLRGAKPGIKLAVEIVAAIAAYLAGVQIMALGGLELGFWSLPVTVLWLVGSANAFNLIDGMDGLASGVGLLATMTMLAAALVHDNYTLALATAPLAGCLLAFLRYNFNPASIFLGDCGALTIGFVLGCFGVIWSQKAATALGVVAPLTALAFPLVDTFLAVVQRFLRRKPIFSADRGHIHHRLLDKGWNPRHVVLLLYAACGIAAVCSLLLQTTLGGGLAGLVLLMFAGLLILSIQYLRYPEFAATRRVVAKRLRGVLSEEIQLEVLRRSLERAESPEQCWELIRDAARDFGMSQAWCRLADDIWSERFDDADPLECWQWRIPLSDHAWVNFSRAFSRPIESEITSQLVQVLRGALGNGRLKRLSAAEAA